MNRERFIEASIRSPWSPSKISVSPNRPMVKINRRCAHCGKRFYQWLEWVGHWQACCVECGHRWRCRPTVAELPHST